MDTNETCLNEETVKFVQSNENSVISEGELFFTKKY